MDNICHTLVGAALAQTGLKHRTRYGTATLLVSANLPDVDILSYAFGGGLTALSFRRGWTHGVLALGILPLLLTGLVLLWSRACRGRGDAPQAPPLRASQVALLATVSILTHPLLDFMNTYGMRWWMPFVNRWYYADALFIVDPWIWVVLVAGLLLTRWTGRETGNGKRETSAASHRRWAMTPAAVSLLAIAVYAAVMLGASQIARRTITQGLKADGRAPLRVMVSPVPLNPLRRLVVIEDADRYRFGTVYWLRRPVFAIEPYEVAKNATAPEALVARQSAEGGAFLSWAR
ncbi:MAG: metal-dependent hydrolase, partial [Gemmatimonadetes bacterium]|nr:metal-dependent hydrolase [Gemmatimonadota bacterium]